MSKKPDPKDTAAEPRSEYEFSGGERGKYAERHAAGATIVMLAPDVAQAFPDSDAVNAGLRELLRLRNTAAE